MRTPLPPAPPPGRWSLPQRWGQPSTHPCPSWAGEGAPGSALLTRPGSGQTGPQMSSSDPNGAWLETPFPPKPWPCCSRQRNLPALLRPLCQPGPRALARSSRGLPHVPRNDTSERYRGHRASAPGRGVTGAHHHLRDPLPVSSSRHAREGTPGSLSDVLPQPVGPKRPSCSCPRPPGGGMVPPERPAQREAQGGGQPSVRPLPCPQSSPGSACPDRRLSGPPDTTRASPTANHAPGLSPEPGTLDALL